MAFAKWKYLPNYLMVFGARGPGLFWRTHLKRRKRGQLFKVRNIWLRHTPSDIATFNQIMVTRDYAAAQWPDQHARLDSAYREIVRNGRVPIIIDAGANIGLASLWFAEQYPEARIFAVEPDEENLAVLDRNVTGLKNVTVLRGGLWDHEAHLRIGNPEAGSAGFRLSEEAGTVPTYSVPAILAKTENATLFIVKIDIEGGEAAVFRSNTAWAAEASLIVIETHDWLYPAEGTSRNLLKVMSGLPVDFLFRNENVFFFSSSPR